MFEKATKQFIESRDNLSPEKKNKLLKEEFDFWKQSNIYSIVHHNQKQFEFIKELLPPTEKEFIDELRKYQNLPWEFKSDKEMCIIINKLYLKV